MRRGRSERPSAGPDPGTAGDGPGREAPPPETARDQPLPAAGTPWQPPPPAAAASAWRQGWILAAGAWRLAWREPLTRWLLALALLLSAVGAVAAVGSPTAGDGAIQMLAVCLQVVPFAVVLLAGDVWRRDADEAAVFARPVDALTYVLGRAAGLTMVGLSLLGAVAAASALGLVAVARLPVGASFAWIGVFAGVYVAPGLPLLCGACLAWLGRGGSGPRYHAAVLLGALLLAFYNYKLDAIAGRAHVLAFLSPLPGFLTLGLALPPALLGAPAVPGWLVANRVLYGVAGFGLLLLAARRRSAGFPRLPLRRVRGWRTLAVASALGAASLLLRLGMLVPRLAPPVMAAAPRLAAAPTPAASALVLNVTADARAGTLRGTARWTLQRPGDVYVLLDAGLRLDTPAGAAAAPFGDGMVPGTAARLYEVHVASAGDLVLPFGGRLLPDPSALPYPPFPLAEPFEGAALGHGRAFFDGRGTWYPVLVGPGLRPAAPGQTTIHLAVTGVDRPWVGVSTRDYVGPVLPPVLGAAAPYQTFSGAGWRLLAAGPPPPAEAAVLTTYARAGRLLAAVLPGDFPSSGPLPVAVSPLLLHPLLSAETLWIPGAEPFCVPADPVAAVCGGTAPDLETATLRLAVIAWEARLELPGGNLALPAQAGRGPAAAELAPRAAVSAWEALGRSAAVAAAWTDAAALPVVGVLDPAQRAEALAWADAAS